ncbi:MULTISPECIES: hypothetical protein [unclassified Rhizobium]|uniref:hypothetical protein n=1 Tax=unclassified Rhizobium TaxID=2613769 RepID=UPI000ABA5B92|nr:MULTISPECIES: hypothetical protein [unclassified Rhizobium]
MVGTTLVITVMGGDDVVLRAARHSRAVAFSKELEAAWTDYNISALSSAADRLARLHSVISGLFSPRRYPAACSLTSVLEDARSLDATLLSKLQPQAIGTEAADIVAFVRR